MARTPGAFSGRGHPETKAGENIRQGKSREDVTERAKETNQQKRSPGLTDSESVPLCGNASVVARLRRRGFRAMAA